MLLILSPEEDEDGVPVWNSIQLVVELQVWLKTVNQARVHVIDLIKDEHGVCTSGDVPSNPLWQLRLKNTFDLKGVAPVPEDNTWSSATFLPCTPWSLFYLGSHAEP